LRHEGLDGVHAGDAGRVEAKIGLSGELAACEGATF
jgi:hypothetical protein